MTASDDEVRRAAAEILPLLPDLVEAPAADALARDLRAAMDDEGEDAPIRIAEILRHEPATREWMRRRLGLEPTAGGGPVRGYQALPGHSPAPSGEHFVCPRCGSPWYRPGLGDAVQPCPRCHEPRVRAVP
jgi:hypothetical protein